MDIMKKEMIAQRVIEALNNEEAFAKELLAAEDAATAQKVLCANGFEVSVEEVEAIFADGMNEIKKFQNPASEELSADQLDDVAGGGVVRGVLRTAASAAAGFGYGLFCGVCPAASAGAPYVAGGLALWSTAGFKKKGW